MPLNRYEIRNEYSLADPELYRAADKDDPEALLEGVTMAGLVGILRQLGDLAEFAAEIFHDLHEEVMATAARGQGLIIRVQELESAVPSIEKAFFSQTDHSSFFYNAGVDWHPNLQMNQNLVTQGDLPRFVMDSYEECRGPPRLFLLDKFDVAGAGSCLKRYTDPSFFKVETSEIPHTDVQREKKSRKAKKRGQRWRNGETPELLPASHAKLHQLFLEECAENGVSNPARRVKLKRRLNGYPFDSKTGKSYMEKLLKTSSPEHKVLHEVAGNSPLLMLTAVEHNESELEMLEVREVCHKRESVERKNGSPLDTEEIMLNPSMYQQYEISKDDKISEVPDSYPSMVTDGITFTLDKVSGERDIAVDEIKTEDSLTGYQSDDIASEVDNYVDAPSTIDSEMDTDSKMRLKSNLTSSLIKTQPLISDPDEDLHNQSSDSQSIEESVMSDQRNNSSNKETSSFLTSDSPSISAENTKSKAISEIDKDDDPLNYQRTADEDVRVHQNPNPLISDHKCTRTEAITNHGSDFEQLASSFCSTNLPPTLEHLNSGVVEKNRTEEPESDNFTSVSGVERKVNLVIGGPCAPGVSDFESRSGDDNRRSSADEQAVDEPSDENIPHEYTIYDDHTNSLIVRSSDFLPPEECDCENLNLIENIASSPNTATENVKLGWLDRKLTEIFWSGRHDKAHFDDDTMSTVSKMEKPTDQLDNEDSNVFIDASNHFLHTTEDSHVKELSETSLSVELRDRTTKEHFCDSSVDNQIDSENLILPQVENSPECPEEALDAHERNVPEKEELTVNENLALETSESCKVVSLVGEEVTEPEVAALESGNPEYLEEISAMLDNVENNEITPCTNPIEDEFDEIFDSSDIKLVDDISVLLDESASEIDLLAPEEMAHFTPAISENANKNNVSLPVVLDKSVEEPTPCSEDSDLGEHEDSQNCLWETQKESVLVEEGGQREATASDVDIIISNSPNNGLVESKAPDNIPKSYLDLDVEEILDLVDGTTIQSPLEQSGLYAEQEIIQQNSLRTRVSDPSSSLTDTTSEERIPQEKIELPSNQFDKEFINSPEISSGLSPFLPIELPEHDDKKEDNNSDNTGPMFSCITSPSPPFSELPGLSNCNIDVSEYPNDSLGSILSPNNLVSETKEINLDELPPLPPLPPVQWRMGKFQLGSAHANGKTIKHELFPRVNFPPIGSTDAVSSSLEDMTHSLVQVAPETAEEKVEQNFSSLDANAMHETIDLQSEKENEPDQPTASTDDVSSSLEETNHSLIQIDVETASKIEKVDLPMNETVDLPPNIENKITTEDDVSSSLVETNGFQLHINPKTAPKAENVQQCSSSSNPNVMHETIDLPPKIETEQWKLIMPFPTSELTPSAEEDEVANVSRKLKLPRPRNPLIDDVVALDKSKLRKVTERVRPQIQQVDERDSLLEQIRTKSFNLKPAMASRPSIRGPRTNLKVAAILEKANAIRQALAGSDEDDEDNWSDS